MRDLVHFYPEVKIGHTRIVTISTDNLLKTNELRDGEGAQWPFLSDPQRVVQQDLDIQEYTDPTNNPMIPPPWCWSRVSRSSRSIWATGTGGVPSIAELWADLREVTRRIRPDWDIAEPEHRAAWERDERTRFFPYGRSFHEVWGEQA